jgi:hypothetical protein
MPCAAGLGAPGLADDLGRAVSPRSWLRPCGVGLADELRAAFLLVLAVLGVAPLDAPAPGLRVSVFCGSDPAKAFFNRRTTGASTVDEADLTNSPISLSFSRTALLSTPKSLANSYTRCFATQFSPNSSDRAYMRGQLSMTASLLCFIVRP